MVQGASLYHLLFLERMCIMKFIWKNLEEIIASTFIIITTLLVVINIIMRYGLNSGIVWSEEVATGCFVWSVFIGAAACFKQRGHVGVDIIVNHLPPALKQLLQLLMDLFLVVLNGYMSYLAIQYISTTYTKLTPVLGVSSAYISSSVLICFILMTIYSINFVYQDLTSKAKEVTE